MRAVRQFSGDRLAVHAVPVELAAKARMVKGGKQAETDNRSAICTTTNQ